MRFSIAIPFYKGMKNADFYLKRCLDSIESQNFKDYEIVITEEGKMAENTNAAIKKSKGELIKILFMDDYLAHEDALSMIDEEFKGSWLVTGCNHYPQGLTHLPAYNDAIEHGINTIGSPSVMTIRNENPMLFDETLDWLLDCDYYKRMFAKYGNPVFLNDINVTIGIHEGQATHILSDYQKQKEQTYLINKYTQ